ncbi:RodZ domain-containing protein [Pseudomaricurvus sp. HS19]|uniref:RodZ domain-containing protein n=1 Tax=Pseudomaricurvus sp. HS19 TaxID=2692626 RepID=UPI00136A0077|nr:RodZ domain-containing protein [Pseudomaricurvus sp. HS19]MYM62996.1 DUF4115 domain-containing protein [Pseudomaricurvus sp. HS19]
MNDLNTDFLAPGEFLREHREQAGFSLQYVAEQLRISATYVKALEENDVDRLPSKPYVIGYLRAYARLLGLDGDPLVASYQNQSTPESVADEEQRVAAAKRSAGLRKLMVPVVIVALLAVWGLSTVLLEKGETPDVASEQQTPQADVAVSPADTDTAQAAAAEAAAGVEEPAAESDAVADAAVADAVVEETVQAAASGTEQAAADELAEEAWSPAEEAPAALDTLTFTFSSECWLEVTDARGDVLAADLYQPGQSVSLQGRTPFDVMLGNARAAVVELNGSAVQLPVQPGRKTLRTQVGAAAAAE